MNDGVFRVAAALTAVGLGAAAWYVGKELVPLAPNQFPVVGLVRAAGAMLVAGILLGAAFARPPRLAGVHPLLLAVLAVVMPVVWRTTVIIRDLSADATSHNLWPFEFVILILAAGVPSLAGVFTGQALARAMTRPRD